MSLQDRASNWQDRLLKGIIFFAILGCIVLTVAVTMVGKMLSDITGAIGEQPKTQTTTTTTTNTSTTAH